MKNKFLVVFFVLAVPKPGWCAPSTLQDRACDQAIRSVGKYVAPAKHKHEYYCSLHEQKAGYFVFRVSSRYPKPADAGLEWAGSNLLGYFAVSRANGNVYNWDIAEDKLGSMLQAPAQAASSGQD
jgi:hypothetical protein